jgi:sec-independent protein translocase protein TatA
MRYPQGMEWIIILVVVLLLFGARRLPDLARSVGKSLKIFKTEVKDLNADRPPVPTPPPTADPAPPIATVEPVAGTSRTAPLATGTPTDDDGERSTP